MADQVRYEAVIFDLDGTLLDSLEDLADSMNSVLVQLEYPVHPVEKYKYFVGDGMRQLARRVLPSGETDEAIVNKTIELMAIEYGKRWSDKTRIYPGLAETLDGLISSGLRLAVLSNKPDPFTKRMVSELLSRWSFDPVFGARPDTPVKPDPQSALEISKIWGIAPERILYVGDTGTDMRTAASAGMHAIGVTWGFRMVEELLEHGAQSIIDQPLELLAMVEKRS